MTALPRRVRSPGSREDGSILIELIVVLSLLAVVLGVVFGFLSTTASDGPKETARPQAIRDAQVGLHRMTRELRQAYGVNATSYVRMDVNVRVGSQDRRVAYDCGVTASPGPRACVRYEAALGAALPAQGEIIINRLLNGTQDAAGGVFFPDDPYRPGFVRTKIEVPAKGDASRGYSHKVVLDDGIYLRNENLG